MSSKEISRGTDQPKSPISRPLRPDIIHQSSSLTTMPAEQARILAWAEKSGAFGTSGYVPENASSSSRVELLPSDREVPSIPPKKKEKIDIEQLEFKALNNEIKYNKDIKRGQKRSQLEGQEADPSIGKEKRHIDSQKHAFGSQEVLQAGMENTKAERFGKIIPKLVNLDANFLSTLRNSERSNMSNGEENIFHDVKILDSYIGRKASNQLQEHTSDQVSDALDNIKEFFDKHNGTYKIPRGSRREKLKNLLEDF